MDFEWDAAKAASNLGKHGVDFADASLVLEDPLSITVPDNTATEERFVTLGADPVGRILVVVFTPRGEKIRLISARKATSRERRHYQERS
jgi:uncharacterized DUF497 family protein